ncbi:hypothetical protein Patl1_23638 [Pistacia atlantica]|uniref:Uncharacterized protein n=1 Tax=Pistacia atlantica TaxID=434234 RepID=A0ACC1A3Y9_9ROSI|nr:hypothetical protein Patl1_23638 [Pistacia atlantica]
MMTVVVRGRKHNDGGGSKVADNVRWKIVFTGGRWFAGGRLDSVRRFCVIGIERKMVSHGGFGKADGDEWWLCVYVVMMVE